MSKKLLLTMSNDGCVIIADVPKDHKKTGKELFVSEAFLCANEKNFVDKSGKLDWDGRIFVLKADLPEGK